MSSLARLGVVFLTIGGMLLLGCKTDPTQLVVVVDTDFDVPSELSLVRVIVLDGDGAQVASRDFPLNDGGNVPFSFAVVPKDADASRRATIITQGFADASDTDPRVTRRAVTGFREHKSLRLDMFLAETCDMRTCAEVTSTCTQDGCIDENIDPNALEEIGPGQEFRERPDAGPAPDGGDDMSMDQCRTAPDRDGDGDRAIACGGADCDDNDDRRSSRNDEVCDDENVDEDCDPDTVGDTDMDNDDRVSSTCCNDVGEGELLCGNDCNDGDPLIGPTRSERCNGLDDNCDEVVDGPQANTECMTMLGGGGTASCFEGSCRVDSCPMGRDDCDAVFDCETDVTSTAAHCGDCDTSCAAGEICAASRCDAVVDVSVGANHACWLYSSGHVGCRGPNLFGQLGIGSTTTPPAPVLVMTDANLADLSLGDDHSCAVRMSGEAVCWGKNDLGQTGAAAAGTNVLVPTAVTGLPATVRQIAAGATHTCALMNDGTIRCWGANSSGQLGDGTTMPRTGVVSVMTANTDYVQVVAGTAHTCARRMGGQLECWGANDAGQLGTGTAGGNFPTPQAVIGAESYALVTAGGRFTCGKVMGRAEVRCWGENISNQLGVTMGVSNATPNPVSASVDAIELDSGSDHTCAVTRAGDAVCWGANATGALGRAAGAMSAMPAPAEGLPGDVAHASGGRSSTYVILTTGELWVFGGSGGSTPMLVSGIP